MGRSIQAKCCTKRIAKLREEVMSIRSTICLERARSYTAVYREDPQLPITIKRALALSKTLRECLNVIKLGFGMPAFNNDEIVIPSFVEIGVDKEDAYGYSAFFTTLSPEMQNNIINRTEQVL